MQAFELTKLLEEQAQQDGPWREFLSVPALSMGIYALAAGATDLQDPHTEDEIYYVVRGRAKLAVGGEDQAVGAGSIVYVAKNVPHFFHSIEEDLTTLVFFAPAEYSQKEAA